MKKERVIVAMSGGVDSSVAAVLLHRQGYEVIGVTMKTWGFMEVGGAPKHESGCCSLDAIFDAKNVADSFGFPHYTLDFTKSFEKEVIRNFVDEYMHGRTPNPCVICNRKIKWEELLLKADSLDAQYISTGHYAKTQINNKTGRYMLQASADASKDQTYALWGLSQASLSRTLFPLGGLTKKEVRKLAEEFGLKTAGKPDSQEICFVADNNYERFLREREPELMQNTPEGDVIYHGKVIGKHRGLPFYTIGQRRGLRISVGKPVYVKEINVADNSIILGDKDELKENYLSADEINYVSRSNLTAGENVAAKIRYSDPGSPAEIIKADETSFSLNFSEPKLAVTPGQSVVLYDDDGFVLAGGLINKKADPQK